MTKYRGHLLIETIETVSETHPITATLWHEVVKVGSNQHVEDDPSRPSVYRHPVRSVHAMDEMHALELLLR